MPYARAMIQTYQKEEAFTKLAELVIQERNLGRVCLFLFDTFETLIPFDRIGIALIDEKNYVCLKWVKSKAGNSTLPVGYKASLNGSSLTQILQTGKTRIINNLEEYLREHPNSESTLKVLADGIRSSLTCPLNTKHGCIGFIFFSSFKINTYQLLHVETFELIASQLAFLFEILEREEAIKSLNLKEKYFHRSLHEMGNSLNLLALTVGLILRGRYGKVNEDLSKALVTMEQRLKNTLTLYEELRDYGDMAPLSSGVRVSETKLIEFLNNFKIAAETLAEKKNIQFTVNLDPELPKAFVMDGKRISQVLMNLLSNAIKFSAPNTSIILSVSLREDEVLFVMRDQGQGISLEDQKEIFKERAFLSNVAVSHEHSSGLGLSICKRIVENHGGKIWVESSVGVGSQFFFSIPTTQETKHGVAGNC